MFLIVNVADKSLLHATPNPRYGSGNGVGVVVGVEVGVLV
jgi:hypothetical protein